MKIPLFKIYNDKSDVAAVSEIIKSGKDWAIGPKIEEFEKAVAKYTGAKYAAAFSSGTAGLHALMIAYGFGKGDEIIVPSFTFIATANATLFVGAKPVFAEIEGDTFGLDPEDVEKKITKNTKAIMVVHYGGCACRIKEIKRIADKHKLILIEDAAESLGAEVDNKKVGTFGDSAMFSFCAPKVITTGEGGVVVTDNKDVYEKIKLIRSHGRLETANYFDSSAYMDYISLGYNFRMSNITAALGVSQLKKIEKIIKMRRKNAQYLHSRLSNIPGVSIPSEPKNYRHIFQMYTIKVGNKNLRDSLKEYLNKKGIMAKVYFLPIHFTDFYKKSLGCKKGDLPITEDLSDSVLTLPMYPGLKKGEMNYIVKGVSDFFTKK